MQDMALVRNARCRADKDTKTCPIQRIAEEGTTRISLQLLAPLRTYAQDVHCKHRMRKDKSFWTFPYEVDDQRWTGVFVFVEQLIESYKGRLIQGRDVPEDRCEIVRIPRIPLHENYKRDDRIPIFRVITGRTQARPGERRRDGIIIRIRVTFVQQLAADVRDSKNRTIARGAIPQM